jgi:hypothetical protein
MQAEIYQVSHLETSLHFILVVVHILLILCHFHVIFESSQDVLTLLNPIFGFGFLIVPKFSIHKGGGVITIQSFERCHPNRHVISGIIEMFTQVKRFDPRLLLPRYIIYQIPLEPFVHNFCFPIILRVIIGTRR